MYCTNCGKPLAETAKFCPACGAAQPNAQGAREPREDGPAAQSHVPARPEIPAAQNYPQPQSGGPAQSYAPPAAYQAKPKKGSTAALIVGGVLLAALLAAGGFFLLKRGGGTFSIGKTPKAEALSGYFDGALASPESGRVGCTMLLSLDEDGEGTACLIAGGENATGAGLEAVYTKGSLKLSGVLSGEPVTMTLGAKEKDGVLTLNGEGESSLGFTAGFTQTSQADLADVIGKASSSPVSAGKWYQGGETDFTGEDDFIESAAGFSSQDTAAVDEAADLEEFGVSDYTLFLHGTWMSDTDPDGAAVVFRFDPDGSKRQAQAYPAREGADPSAYVQEDWEMTDFAWSGYSVEGNVLTMSEWDWGGPLPWTIEIIDEGTVSIDAGDGNYYLLHRIGEAAEDYVNKSVTDYTTIGSNENTDAVKNGPRETLQVSFDKDVYVQAITTYHWNNGKGKEAGSISITDEDGNWIGEWDAVGREGYLDAQSVYWDAYPDVVLKAGIVYFIQDSDNATWSYNSGSDGAGFANIRGYAAEE